MLNKFNSKKKVNKETSNRWYKKQGKRSSEKGWKSLEERLQKKKLVVSRMLIV